MAVFGQTLAIIALLVVGAICVQVHDAEAASPDVEPMIAQFGHLDAVIYSDVGVGVVLLLVAGLSLLHLSKEAKRKVSLVQSMLLMFVVCLMAIQFVAKVEVLRAEDQRILSLAGKWARVVALFETIVVMIWSLVLCFWFWNQSRPELRFDS